MVDGQRASAERQDRILGSFLGTAVGDSLGLPAEGVSRRRSVRWIRRPWRQDLLFGRGMLSDDTEHTVFVAQALLSSHGETGAFTRRLAWSLRWWLVSLPAGVGLATLRAICKSWLGMRPPRCAVWSAGNGPAMRVAPIGAWCAGESSTADGDLVALVHASTTVTHRDPKACIGALAVARLVAWGICSGTDRPSSEEFLALLAECGPSASGVSESGDDEEWSELLERIRQSLANGDSVSEFADRIGLERGVTGHTFHTVPVAVYAWFVHLGDFRGGLTAVLDLGGDADTVGAITGAMLGAASGSTSIPLHWVDRIVDWPRGVPLLRELADRIASVRTGQATAPHASRRGQPVRYFWPGVLPRNMVFLVVVLGHGLRRLLPPY